MQPRNGHDSASWGAWPESGQCDDAPLEPNVPRRRLLAGPLATAGLVVVTTLVWLAIFVWMW